MNCIFCKATGKDMIKGFDKKNQKEVYCHKICLGVAKHKIAMNNLNLSLQIGKNLLSQFKLS